MEKSKKFLFVLLFIYIILKFIYLCFLSLPLSYDESYYWDWSRILDFGYYNKPPMVAYLIRISTEIFGNSEFAVRLPAFICNTLTLIFSYLLIAHHFNKERAIYLLLTFCFLPILTVYSFIMTTDPPLILFWILALYFFLNYLKNPVYKNAIFTGLFIGLGLLTKQTMFVFFVLLIIYLFLFNKKLLFKAQTLLIFFISIFVYSPNIYWNLTHNFILIKHTEEHFTNKTLSLTSLLTFIGETFFVYSSLCLIFLYLGIKFTKIIFKKNTFSDLKFLYFLSFPLFIFFIFSSYFIRININWIFPFILTGLIFVFAYINLSKIWKFFIFVNLLICFLSSILIYFFGYFPQKFPDKVQLLLKNFIGWKRLAQEIEKYYQESIPLVCSHRSIASSLAFYMKTHPFPYVIQSKNFPENQYHLWRKTNTLKGKKVIVVKKYENKPEYLKNPQKLGKIIIKVTKNRYKYYTIWKGLMKEQ